MKRLWILLTALMLLMGSAQAEEKSLNILLIGVDSRTEEVSGRSDTMLLVRADPANGSIRMVSFLRDLYVRIPSHGRNRLNAAYVFGGEELLKQTLEEQFGVTVDRTATVHFDMLADLVDQLGGVEIELTNAERLQINQSMPKNQKLSAAGTQTLNGAQALAYSRIRKIDSDFQRTSRQQAVIAAMMKRAGELGYWELLKLAWANLPHVQTDLSFADIVNLAPLVTRLDSLDLKTAHVPFDGAYEDATIHGMMVLVPQLERCRELLADFLQPK